jgi:hypothetical protein
MFIPSNQQGNFGANMVSKDRSRNAVISRGSSLYEPN